MMASTHLVFAVTCWATYERLHGINVLSAPETLVVAGFASLLPDIDHPKSRFGRMVPFLSYPISAVFGHRGITHSLLMIIAMIAVMWLYGATAWIIPPLVIGYLSHLIGDMFTNSGVPLFWPRKDKVSYPVFNTGGIIEIFVRIVLILIFVALVWQSRVSVH